MMLGRFLWLLSGMLMSFGVLGFLTGLVVLPFGVGVAVHAGRSHRSSWPWFMPGLGLGPVVLLSDDVVSEHSPAGAVPVFWVGVALVVLGGVLAVYVSWQRRHST